MAWPKYDTYQDVKNTLVGGTGMFLLVLALSGVWFLTEPKTKASIWDALGASVPGAILVVGGLLSLLTVLAYLLVYYMRLHEYWEKTFQRWRKTYDVDFIIPRLAWPFAAQLPDDFLDRTWTHHEDIMEEAYYRYVRDREPAISKNRLVRFYEKIAPFWFTHVVDAVSTALSLLLVTLALVGSVPPNGALWLLLGLLLATLIARYARGVLLWEVRRATLDEIGEIHANPELAEDLKNRLQGSVSGGAL